MDSIDTGILELLQKDGRRPYSEIARSLDISNTMVHQRVTRMKQAGYIKGIELHLDERKMGYEWSAFTGLILRADSDSESIIQALQAIPEVTECYYITGKYA